MTKIIGAPTLDDALEELSVQVVGSERTGRRCVVFCEDKLTLLAERAVVRNTGGTFLSEVTTFARFLSGERAVLSKQGSVMAISSILRAEEGNLHCFKKNAAQVVYETIAQLLSSRADAELLKKSAEETDGMLRHKLCDLALVLEKYDAFLKEKGLLDENGYLALLPARINEKLRGADVIFFAFPSFTKQALEGVRAALCSAENVTGIFLAGRGAAYTNEAASAFRRIAEETGTAEVRMRKSSLTGDALALSEGLFDPAVYGKERKTPQHIRIFRAADEADEMNTVCAQICRLVREEGLRFRDIAVLLPDSGRLQSAERALAGYKIPFFSDRKRPFSEHPFCAFVLSLLACAHDGGLPESVDAAAANVYFGEADEYRNYLLKYGGYRGGVHREIKTGEPVKHFCYETLVRARERMKALLGLFPREGKGKKYTDAIRACYDLVGGKERTEKLMENFAGAEREFLDLSPLGGVLSEIDSLAAEERFSAFEFSTMLKSGLDALEIAMIPQSADAVFLGEAGKSMFERVPVLFCLGMDDSVPHTADDTAVISDGEIKRLKSLSLEIEPAIAVVNARARESLFLNLCAFSGELYAGCPYRVKGEEARRGTAFLDLERMFYPIPMPENYPYDSCERTPALKKLSRLREDVEAGRESPERFSSLYQALVSRGERETADRMLGGGQKGAVGELSDLLFAGEISPTLLESYFTCPYAGFASRGLRLREREERSVLDTDTGTFVHTVLERLAPRFNEISTEEECRSVACDVARELLSTPRYAPLSDTGAGVYTAERLIRECGEVTAACYRQLVNSRFRVLDTEKKVDLPLLTLSGRADRIDAADGFVRVIDYKTGAIDDTATAYYTGRKLQLELYLLAVSGEQTPAGAFYFPAQENFSEAPEDRYRMKGFFMKEDDVLTRMDTLRTEGKSAFYDGGGRSEKGLPKGEFEDFLGYSLLVSDQAVREMKAGNISPSPYGEACSYCKFKGMCGFSGSVRKESAVSPAEIVRIVRRERGEEE